MDDIFGEQSQSYGEANVMQPEKHTVAVTQYITYLVKVKLGEDQYSCRKRYSDFEWLRQAIATCFPGVRVPPLPKKQGTAQGILAKTGWQEDAFIEERRAGLEDFLQGLLKRRELCVESQILKRFLVTTTEQDLEELKKKIDSVSVAAKYQKYSTIFAEFKDVEVPDDNHVASTKRLLSSQTDQLRELADGLKEAVDAQQAVTKAVSSAQSKLAAVAHTETGCQRNDAARAELVAGLREQRDAMQAFPAMHYDLLLAASERELLEAEAMLEALNSVEEMQQKLEDTQRQVENAGAILKSVLDGGEIPSTGTGVARMLGIAPKKDREERIAQMKADYEQKQKEVTATKEFQRLARVVLIRAEIDKFFTEKTAEQRKVKDTFASLSRKAAERLMSAWESKGALTSHGYPALASADDDVEYEG